MNTPLTLDEFIIQKQREARVAKGDLSAILGAIKLTSKIVHREVNKAGLLDVIGNTGDKNSSGEQQQKLDVFANEKFKIALSARGNVCGLASEEDKDFVTFPGQKNIARKYVVALDPIDGSSNIDVNIPVGTIFSIYRRMTPENSPVSIKDFLRYGDEQIAAGYVIYGSSTMLVYTTGDSVNGFTFDPSIGTFYLSHEDMHFPKEGTIYSINEGNTSRFSDTIHAYLNLCKSHSNQRGQPYTSRYIGSLVADFHRNLLKGGIFIYPSLTNATEGKLRLLYECNPLAFIAERAGGSATDGKQRILNIPVKRLHQRSPLFIGSSELVEEAHSFLSANRDSQILEYRSTASPKGSR